MNHGASALGREQIKLRGLLIISTFVLIMVTLPHALEDFQYRELARFGISTALGVVALALMYGAQLLGISLVVRGRSGGALVLALVGAIWCLGDIVIHGHEMLFAGPEYRHAAISKALELFIMVLGGSIAWIGWRVSRA